MTLSVLIFSSCANFLGLHAILQIFAQFCHVFLNFLHALLVLIFQTQSCVSVICKLFATLLGGLLRTFEDFMRILVYELY